MWNAGHRRLCTISPRTIGAKHRPELSQLWLAGLLVFGLSCAVSGCSTLESLEGTPKPSAPVTPAPPAPDTKLHARVQVPKQKPKPPVTETREADTHEPEPPPAPKVVASIDPNNLIGLDPNSVQKLLGAPTNIGYGSPSIVWTYSGSGCMFQVIFYPDIKTANFHALKFLASDGAGGHADETCIHNLLALRNNGPA